MAICKTRPVSQWLKQDSCHMPLKPSKLSGFRMAKTRWQPKMVWFFEWRVLFLDVDCAHIFTSLDIKWHHELNTKHNSQDFRS
jgi:hypothetical protein